MIDVFSQVYPSPYTASIDCGGRNIQVETGKMVC